MELTNISEIRPLLERHGFTFSKSLGQNFLINRDVPVKIAEGSGVTADSVVLEIGPGIGCLTKELAKRAKKVIAVEIDRRLIPVLKETLSEFDNVEIINGDIMELDLCSLNEKYGKLTVAANLPYYITTPIIMRLLESGFDYDSITVMVQKEVARRFSASAGSKEYGAVTAAIAYRTVPKTLFTVSAGNFIPAPKVDSAVVRLLKAEPEVKAENERLMFSLIKAGFGQRRKTFVNAVSELGYGKEEFARLLEASGISPAVRAEKLSANDFARLSNVISSHK